MDFNISFTMSDSRSLGQLDQGQPPACVRLQGFALHCATEGETYPSQHDSFPEMGRSHPFEVSDHNPMMLNFRTSR